MSRLRTLGSFLLLASLVGIAPAAETVRVDCSTGVPRLLVDGRPTRARIFFGAPGSRPLRVPEQWQEISFEFTPSEDEPAQATMHFRFGQTPGDIILDDIRVESLDGQPDVVPLCDFENGIADFEQDWTYWPLRLAAARAGVHLYTLSDCNVYANGPFVVVHAAHDGPIAVNTGDTRPVTDYWTGNVLGPGPHITLEMVKGDTRILVLGDPLAVPVNRE